MTITNHAWVAAHMGASATVSVTGTVVDVVEADDELGGVFLVVENDETGETARSYAVPPLTPEQEADRAAAAAEADRIAEEERVAAASAAEAAAEAERAAAKERQRALEEEAEARTTADRERRAAIRSAVESATTIDDIKAALNDLLA